MSTLRKVLEKCLCYIKKDLEVGNLLSAFNTLKYYFWREGCFIESEDEETIDYVFVANCKDGKYRVIATSNRLSIEIHGHDNVEIKP